MFAEGVYRSFFFFSCTGLIPEEAGGKEEIKYILGENKCLLNSQKYLYKKLEK